MAGTTLLATIAIRATRHASASTTRSFLFTRNERSRLLGIYGCLLCLLAMQAPANAQAPTNKWSFQRTGFRTTGGNFPQTALSMRSGEAWPVVYGFYENSLNAYSLFPVINPNVKPHVGPNTNWHQIGSNLAGSQFPLSGPYYLQAASGSPDGFAVSAQVSSPSSFQDTVAIGNSQGGFQSPIVGAQAVKFDDNGNSFTATSSSIPGLPTTQKLYDIDASKSGDMGAITQDSRGAGTQFWQKSPL